MPALPELPGGLGAGISGLLGNSFVEQILIWNTVQQLTGAALGPFLQAASNAANSAVQEVPLSPADLAAAVVRGEMDEATAADQAKQSGIDPTHFHTLYRLSGNAPAPEALAEALRRGLIDADRYLTGIRQGMLRDEWSDLVKALSVQQPSPVDAMTALVEGQLSEADARTKFAEFGGDPTQFDWLFGTVGAGPSPLEAATMAYRGVIPWDGKGLGVVSFEQAVAEGHTRNKWEPAYRALSEYLPPPRTITAMVKEGALTQADAATLLQKQGLSASLAASYLQAASAQKTAATKDLALGTVRTLYADQLITRADAASMITALGYDATEADFILQIVDVQLAQKFLDSAIGRVHTLYVGHKIDKTTAVSVLTQLAVPPDNVTGIVTIWDYERAANVRTLTPAEIASAYKSQIVDQATAQQLLEQLGYVPHDAWLYLSIALKAPQPGEPPVGSVGAAPGP